MSRNPFTLTSLRIPLALSVAVLLLDASDALSAWEILPNAPVLSPRHEDVWFIDEWSGWVVNGNGEIWHTSDAGDRWDLQKDTNLFHRSVTFANAERGWVGSLFGPPANRIYETFDGGKHWNPVANLPSGGPAGICGMWAVDEQVVYATGTYNGPAGAMKTTDGGSTWTVIP